ncbi:MAG: WYL domain-containing protein [Brevundimonas sp.]
MNIPVALRQRLFIVDYVDALGEASRRRIAPREIFDSGGQRYLEAFCVSRNDLRRFRLDRIQGVFCDDTGEDLGEASDLFSPDASGDRSASVSPGLDMMQHALRVLAALGRADGALDEAEIAVMASFVRATIGAENARLVKFLTGWGARQAPDLEEYRSSLDRLAQQHQAALPNLLDACGKLISADEDVSPAEMEWMDHLVEVLGRYGLEVQTDDLSETDAF